MNFIILIFIFFLFSCNYPDIDFVTKEFKLGKTKQEKCDYIYQIKIEDKEYCKIMNIMDRF